MAPHNPNDWAMSKGRCLARGSPRVFVAEVGLTEGIDAGVDGVDPGAQGVDPAIQSTFHGVDASRQEGGQGDAVPLCSAETSASCKAKTAGEAGACVGPHTGVFGCRETNKRARFPGYWSVPAPKKRRHTESYGFVLRPNGPIFALEAILGYLEPRSARLARPAGGNEDDLRKRPALQKPPRRQRALRGPGRPGFLQQARPGGLDQVKLQPAG